MHARRMRLPLLRLTLDARGVVVIHGTAGVLYRTTNVSVSLVGCALQSPVYDPG